MGNQTRKHISNRRPKWETNFGRPGDHDQQLGHLPHDRNAKRYATTEKKRKGERIRRGSGWRRAAWAWAVAAGGAGSTRRATWAYQPCLLSPTKQTPNRHFSLLSELYSMAVAPQSPSRSGSPFPKSHPRRMRGDLGPIP